MHRVMLKGGRRAESRGNQPWGRKAADTDSRHFCQAPGQNVKGLGKENKLILHGEAGWAIEGAGRAGTHQGEMQSPQKHS